MAEQKIVHPYNPDGRHTGYVETQPEDEAHAPQSRVLGLGGQRRYVVFAIAVFAVIGILWMLFAGGDDAALVDDPAPIATPAESDTPIAVPPATDN